MNTWYSMIKAGYRFIFEFESKKIEIDFKIKRKKMKKAEKTFFFFLKMLANVSKRFILLVVKDKRELAQTSTGKKRALTRWRKSHD